MIHGYFPSGTNLPYLEVSIFSGNKNLHVPFVIDTGFSGYLKIDQRMADELGIVLIEDAYMINANSERVRAGLARGYVEMEGAKRLVDILIVPGTRLAGVELFSIFNYKIVIDCRSRTAHLEVVI